MRRTLRKQKREASEIVAYALLLSGTIALVISILYSSSILAFSGLGLTLWGALLLFIKPTKYVKAILLDSTVLSSLKAMDRVIADSDLRGKAVYLPPNHLHAPKGGIVFIPSKEKLVIPTVDVVEEKEVFLDNPKGICLTPPGLGLADLYENELAKDFTKADLNYLQRNLPKLFVEDLEIAEDLEMNIEGDRIRVIITGSIYQNLCDGVRELSKIFGSIGCPLCSSIAVALTRTTGRPLIIEKTEVSENEKIEAYYRIIEE